MAAPPFDVDGFPARPLLARVAAGPTVRPVWFLSEERACWWLPGGWSRLAPIPGRDARVALVVDTCEPATGEVRSVTARGEAEVRPFGADRARRKLRRDLGGDEAAWDPRFGSDTGDATARLVRLEPDRLVARDASYRVRA